jgi:hypothetical protein
MVELAITTIVYLLIIIFDFIPVIKTKKKTPIFIYAFCLLSAYIVNILIALNIKIFSPAIPIRDIVTAIFHVK